MFKLKTKAQFKMHKKQLDLFKGIYFMRSCVCDGSEDITKKLKINKINKWSLIKADT